MPKFTPGPWIITGLPQRKGNFGIWSNAGSVASVSKGRNGSSYTKPMLVEEGHANAHLIAAAPEMHAKLDKLATWLERNAALKESWIKTCRFESINDEERANAKNFRATAADIRRLLAKADGEE